jgi:hypothetical protein
VSTRRGGPNPLDPAEEIRLEGLLNSTIKLVEPRDKFVQSLEKRLFLDQGEVELPPRSLFSYLLLVSSVVLTISMITVVGIRIVWTILGILGLAQQLRSDHERQDVL